MDAVYNDNFYPDTLGVSSPHYLTLTSDIGRLVEHPDSIQLAELPVDQSLTDLILPELASPALCECLSRELSRRRLRIDDPSCPFFDNLHSNNCHPFGSLGASPAHEAAGSTARINISWCGSSPCHSNPGNDSISAFNRTALYRGMDCNSTPWMR